MTPESQIIVYNPDVNLTERKSALNNNIQEVVTVGDLRGYKVYTALLTQSGGDNPESFTSGSLSIGRTYEITDYQLGDDFTNVGAPSNASGVKFVAIGDTPSVWTNSSELSWNYGAPLVTVLENTIGNIWWTYGNVGSYSVNSDRLFIPDKTCLFSSVSSDSGYPKYTTFILSTVSEVIVQQFEVGGTGIDEIGNKQSIEIRVYN
jgi:hypothetical protein